MTQTGTENYLSLKNTVRLFLVLLFHSVTFGQSQSSPNVLVIITDDQGYGDLGVTGNPHIKTPVLDAFARESIRFTNFYVSPVCAPTRASLMTGRYSLRTGVRDTYNGGANMASSEITIAELLKQKSYRTGIFGKWHLGDVYPHRPMDQGFDESVIHLSGGMGQVGDFTTWFQGDRSYFDPVLWRNGKQQAYPGYCSDIFAQEAISFIEANKEGPFFCYLSFNAPHTPLQVPEKYNQMYRNVDPSADFADPKGPFPKMTRKDKEDARKVYAMVSNIDDNVGKVLDKLEESGIAENTIVIFLTDNGPQQRRYVAGMRGRKGSVYRGGVRVPFYMRFPAKFDGNKDISTNAVHMDILPTLAEICGLELPVDRRIDGRSLLPLLNSNEQQQWSERPLFFYWTRKYPERYYNMALVRGDQKLVANTDHDGNILDYEFYDLKTDPWELENRIEDQKDMALQLKEDLDKTYLELVSSPNLVDPPRAIVGATASEAVVLNRNDAEGDRGIWAQEEVFGKWRVTIKEGYYKIRFKFIKPIQAGGRMVLEANTLVAQQRNEDQDTDELIMENVYFPDLECDLIPFYGIGSKRIFPFWVELTRLN
ncbi:arylsulfatase [Poritiphilus flavus]|uniref:Sulfatase-like hydrolase/transferase n=1 Tax=Poritiphilus flavus TaxID=2697053 RepID=A0A6L9E8C9_9FLAO|nr:arylsulfatase [Poritiphilus flavus]NAS10848.1 sulfatase-like hydrolase/transferase [Poritiphilus flavus]